MAERLIVDIQKHVATVTLNRPAKNNAIDIEMFEALIETGTALATNNSVRAVVLHGAGEHFCAGLDLSIFQTEGVAAVADSRMLPREESPANFFQSAAYVWREIPVPVIAAITGVAFGGGLQIALGADIRYASAVAQFSIMEIKWGIIPDMAITTTAQRVARIDRLKELAYTGRVIEAGDAIDYGLITAIKDDPLAAATGVCEEIAMRSPHAVRSIKSLFDDLMQPNADKFLRREAREQLALMGTPNQLEAVMANLQRRNPHFDDV